MNWIKSRGVTLILVAVLLVGLGLIAYPTVADYWNSFHQSRAIASYAETVAAVDDTDYEKILEDAHTYNEKLAGEAVHWELSDEEKQDYNSQLDVTGTGIMGYIEIDKIKCSLPIYHGTDEGVLQIAIGHIAGSSLPVGGESTHVVLSGHRGLPSAKLFTDLDKLELKDTFVIRTMDEMLTYEVDQILIVEPDNLTALGIEEGKDLCTLVTCTPYGINTHRLLVRGHRVENAAAVSRVRVTADAIQIDKVMVAPFVAAPILLILIIYVFVSTGGNRNKRRKREDT
ncbi:MAG: class C sortase [Eubacteriales bacterium]|nr:class C sortase [Eubacteriales bacterium]